MGRRFLTIGAASLASLCQRGQRALRWLELAPSGRRDDPWRALGGAVMRRGPFFALLFVALLGLVLTPAIPASAQSATLSRYAGPAPGSVSCQFEAKVSFSRPLTASGGAGNPSKVKGRLESCLSSDSVLNIRSGRITGSFVSGFGSGCTWNGNEAATLTISWRGSVNGAIGATTYRGRASFTPSVVSYSGEQLLTDSSGDEGFALPGSTHSFTATGSFPGSSTDDRMATGYSALTPSAITSACGQRRGLRSLTFSGAITIGAGIVAPPSITVGPDGALWATDVYGNDRITTSGAISDYTDPNIVSASDITSGPDGALWFTDFLGGFFNNTDGFAGTIGRLSTSGVLTTFSDPSISLPQGITTGPDGALWFTNSGSNSIGRITTSGVVSNYSDPSVDANPTAITTGPDGALWFTNSGSNSIGRITTSGAVTIYTSLSINGPNGITSGPDSALWFTNDGDNTIGRITTSGVATSYGDPSINIPGGITTGPDGALWFTNGGSPPINFSAGSYSFGGSSSIGRITTSGVVTRFTDPSINSPGAITSGPDGAVCGSPTAETACSLCSTGTCSHRGRMRRSAASPRLGWSAPTADLPRPAATRARFYKIGHRAGVRRVRDRHASRTGWVMRVLRSSVPALLGGSPVVGRSRQRSATARESTVFWSAHDRNSPPSPKLENPFIAQDVHRPQHGVLVHSEHARNVFHERESLSRAGLTFGYGPTISAATWSCRETGSDRSMLTESMVLVIIVP